MKKHLASTIALGIGVLSVVSGLTKMSSTLIAGIIIILGALAYRSAKRRKLGEITHSSLRKTLQICAIVIIIAAVVLQKNLTYHIATDPVPNLIIPLWAIIAYLVIALKKQKAVRSEASV
jgi:hypothetical protein